MAFNWLLRDGVSAQVLFQGATPTPRAIDRLIDYLKFMKTDLAEAPEPANDDPERLRDLEAEDDV